MPFRELPIDVIPPLHLPRDPPKGRATLRHHPRNGLADSGAEHSVLSIELIQSLGLPTENAQAVEVIGVGVNAGRGYLLDVEHQLGNHHWMAPAIFSDVTDSQSPMIIGQAGFFEFFRVTFKRRKLLMDILRAR